MKIKFYSDIVDEQSRLLYEWDGNTDAVSFQSIQKLLASRGEDDKRIDLFFNCKGGDCIEGLAIYDLLRQQDGCEIYATIEGECSSVASVILLAAPKENRKAYANAHLCIHNPAVCYFESNYYDRLTADNIRKTAEQILNQAESLQAEQNKMLATYVERTGTDAETLQSLMNQDVYVDMAKAQELGFISGVMPPMTAYKNARFKAYHKNQDREMNKNKAKVTAFEKVVTALKEMVGIEDAPNMVALEVTDVDGNVVTVEREEGDPKVGDAASPDGTFVLEDGTTIVVDGGVIASITPAVEKPTDEPANEPTEDLQQKVDELTKVNEELSQKVDELMKKINELTEQIPTEEAKAIVTMVANAGGKAVVEKALTARSTFNANNTKRVDRKAPEEPRLGESFLEEQNAAHAAALAKIRK